MITTNFDGTLKFYTHEAIQEQIIVKVAQACRSVWCVCIMSCVTALLSFSGSKIYKHRSASVP